jgi:oligoribonuclease (3'-5' exoribonuclease)
LFSGTNPLNS